MALDAFVLGVAGMDIHDLLDPICILAEAFVTGVAVYVRGTAFCLNDVYRARRITSRTTAAFRVSTMIGTLAGMGIGSFL